MYAASSSSVSGRRNSSSPRFAIVSWKQLASSGPCGVQLTTLVSRVGRDGTVRHVLGERFQRVDEGARGALERVVVVERRVLVLGQELRRRLRVVTEDVAHRLVELAPREPARPAFECRGRRFPAPEPAAAPLPPEPPLAPVLEPALPALAPAPPVAAPFVPPDGAPPPTDAAAPAPAPLSTIDPWQPRAHPSAPSATARESNGA